MWSVGTTLFGDKQSPLSHPKPCILDAGATFSLHKLDVKKVPQRLVCF